jgi:hypothetical protein
MRRIFLLIITIFLLWTVVCGLWTKCGITDSAYAEVPHLINYQGRLTDKEGKPVSDGAYSITFRIYDAQNAGNLLWEETHSSVLIQKGIFSVLLGSVTNLNLTFDKPYFLEIKTGDEVMIPRQQITSAGYAIRAEEAEKLSTPIPDSDLNTISTAGKVSGAALTNLNSIPAGAGVLPISNGGTSVTNKLVRTVQYTGSGSTLKIAHGLQATPTCIILTKTSGFVRQPVLWMTGFPQGWSTRFDGHFYDNYIQAVDATYVTLGLDNHVNADGEPYSMTCWVGQ